MKRRKPGRDALGRKRRAERRLIEALQVTQDIDEKTGTHRALPIIQKMLKAARKELTLSLSGAKEVTKVSRAGIRKIEKADGKGNMNTMLLLIFGYRLRLDHFFREVWRRYLGMAPG